MRLRGLAEGDYHAVVVIPEDFSKTLAGIAGRDPDAAEMLAALDRVRGELTHLGVDAASAADVPAAVTARIGAALHAQPPHGRVGGPAHSIRHTSRWQLVALIAGVGAALVGVVLGDAGRARVAPP